MPEDVPLPAQLSAAFVAMAVEIDNAAESRIAHRTTSYGGSGDRGSIWLTSIAMWFNAVRVLNEVDQLTVAEVRERTGLDTNVDGLRRWGYVTVDGVARRLDGRKRPLPKASSVLTLTRQGRDAAAVWEPLPAEVEQRWCDRFGRGVVDRLRAALLSVVSPADRERPDYLPILSVGLWAERHRAAPLRVVTRPAAGAGDEGSLPLISLLARVLLVLTLNYEADARLALPVWTNGLRLLATEPTPVRNLPVRAGVGTKAMTMVLTHLERAGCVDISAIPGRRGKQVGLTERGERARAAGARRFAGLGHDGAGAAVAELRAALHPLVKDSTRAGSPLFTGLDPGPGNWRANISPPECLPWHPLVLHRGGYPDGS
jgi:DNA-binding MarR family transcriptional regulator